MLLEHDNRLLPCPFCGGEAILAHVEFLDNTTWYNPQCFNCYGGWNENYETKEEAINAWNRRNERDDLL
jgi:Lar family restriction alleviation protein